MEADLLERRRGLAAALLGLDAAPSDDLQAAHLVRRGLGTHVIGRLRAGGLDARLLDRIVPRRTLEHRRQRNEPLTREESERAYRAANVVALAEVVFGDRAKALSWLNAPKERFGGETAMDLLDTDVGTRLVEESLVQIDEGYFA